MRPSLLALAILGTALPAAADHAGPAGSAHSHAAASACPDAALACANAATPYFGPDDRLWLVWSAAGRVMVAHSTDQGRHFSPPVAANQAAEAVDDNGEARPRLLTLRDGTLLVSWTVRRDAAYNGTVMVARSTDGGKSFEPPRPLVSGETSISQRFQILAQLPDGDVLALWLDKPPGTDGKVPGAALAASLSTDGGGRFQPARRLFPDSCECCRIGLAADLVGRAVVSFRAIYPGSIRDHAVATLTADGLQRPVRVSVDDWKIDACPHHGPALAVDGNGTQHTAWYTEGARRQGLFYARRRWDDAAFSAPLAFGDASASHPQLAAGAAALWLAWKEFDGQATQVKAMASRDGGASWSAARVVARTGDASDHPLLMVDATRVWLSWLSRQEGYRLIELRDAP